MGTHTVGALWRDVAEGRIVQALSAGALVDLEAVKKEWLKDVQIRQKEYAGTALGGSGLAGPEQVIDNSRWVNSTTDLGLCFVARVGNVTDDTPWEGIVWKIGTYQYQAVGGFPKTVPKYTASRADAAFALGFAPPGALVIQDTGKTIEVTAWDTSNPASPKPAESIPVKPSTPNAPASAPLPVPGLSF
jgi:hypothetical protein